MMPSQQAKRRNLFDCFEGSGERDLRDHDPKNPNNAESDTEEREIRPSLKTVSEFAEPW